jgi:hypothetical protein
MDNVLHYTSTIDFQKHNPQRYIRSYRNIVRILGERATIIMICVHIVFATCVLNALSISDIICSLFSIMC